MILLAATAVCYSLLFPSVQFCTHDGKHVVICMRDGCHTPRAVARSPRLLRMFYGEDSK